MDDTLKKLMEKLFDLCKNGFYGSFTINFQNGKIVNWNKSESGKFD
jgi:hypothetical protein